MQEFVLIHFCHKMLKAQEKMQELFFHWLYILLQNKENSWKDKRLTYQVYKTNIFILGF
jgi:hypothetical protein